jgi:hypothetical protein
MPFVNARPATYIGGVWNLKITAVLSSGVQIPGTDLKVYNDPKAIRDFLALPKTRELIGGMEFSELLSGRPVAVRQASAVSVEELRKGTIEFIKDLTNLWIYLWMYRDNAVNGEMVFGIASFDEGITTVHSNFHALRYTRADCTEDALELRRREFLEALDLVEKPFKIEGTLGNVPKTALTKSTSRLTRFIYHLENARRAEDLALKIASYCNAFEALLSTSNTELAHTLSERLSLLLSTGTAERITTYKLAKRLYAIRSNVSHGGPVSSDIKHLVDASIGADNLARGLLKKTFKSEQLGKLFQKSENQEIDDHFIRIVME